MRKTCVVALSPKPTSIACIAVSLRASSPRPGVATKKSATRAARAPAGRTSANPPAPGPVSGLSITQAASAAATAASDGVPALLQDARPCSRAERMSRRDRASHETRPRADE